MLVVTLRSGTLLSALYQLPGFDRTVKLSIGPLYSLSIRIWIILAGQILFAAAASIVLFLPSTRAFFRDKGPQTGAASLNAPS